jgi:hypothetical protein
MLEVYFIIVVGAAFIASIFVYFKITELNEDLTNVLERNIWLEETNIYQEEKIKSYQNLLKKCQNEKKYNAARLSQLL